VVICARGWVLVRLGLAQFRRRSARRYRVTMTLPTMRLMRRRVGMEAQ
jgi:hypothetical protein